MSKNVLEVSTVMDANVPSVIWAQESLRPLDLLHSSDLNDCLRKFRHLKNKINNKFFWTD